MSTCSVARPIFTALCVSAVALLDGYAAEPSPGTYPRYVPEAALTGDIRITCESSAEPLMKIWVERFSKFHPGFDVIAKGTSPIASVPMVMSGAYELGFPARELWPSEEESFQKIRGYPATVVMIGLGAHRTAGLTPALGVYVNAANPIQRITLQQLDA